MERLSLAVAQCGEERKDMTLRRMDNVLVVVDDLEAAKAFFIELGLKLEGETTVEGPLVGRLIGPPSCHVLRR